jgi:phenylalanyl-tRNA synthetase beta chain
VLVPLSWLAEYVDLPAGLSPRDVSAGLIRIGQEVEGVEETGADLVGPLVVGRVLEFEEFTAGNGKTVRWCQVQVEDQDPLSAADPAPAGAGAPVRGIICGARNFATGDAVVVALPGAVLPGGFAISARKTYGHVSDGMICSARELGLGDDHSGIMVLPPDAPIGTDAIAYLELRDVVLDIAVTTDRGYALSMRGMAREAAHAFGVPYRDPAAIRVPEPDAAGWAVRLADAGCDRFSARTVTGVDPAAPSPLWLRRRLLLAGMRPISLIVDITNYVMLELGQPMHAFDRAKLRGAIEVRRARPGERLTTLDGVDRVLDPDDLLVTDDSGPIALAGVMGGASTEIGQETADVVLEAAHWDPASVFRTVRRHKLPSEAARRFERGVDPDVAGPALQRAADLLLRHGGGTIASGYTVVGADAERVTITLDADLPGHLAGVDIGGDAVVRRLEQVGCVVGGASGGILDVVPPSWRPDLLQPADLVEEVIRLEGYDKIPSVLPTPPPGGGLTADQRLRRSIGRALAEAGYVEVRSYPFLSPSVHDVFGLPEDDPRRRTLRLANPLADTEPDLRTSLLPGLLATLRRNLGRGLRDVALFESGSVYLPRPDTPPAPVLGVDGPPTAEQLAALDAALPDQPRHLAVALSGERDPAGWWGQGRTASWADAVEAGRTVAVAAGVPLTVRATQYAPWHPGRCAEFVVTGPDGAEHVIGHAGELHPRVLTELDLPARTAATELDLDALGHGPTPRSPFISSYPPALLDVALVVGAQVPAAEVESALRTGAGELLESIRLFDVYADDARLGAGRRSLAYALRFRAGDRTLTAEEASSARDAAVAEAGRRTGAALRS